MNFSQLHAWLNASSLPRAIADFREHSFVAWNSTFLKQTGYSESRIKVIKPEDIIVFGDLRFQLPSGSNYPAAEFITCAIRTTLRPAALSGHVVKSLGRLGYVMIHDASSVARAEVESARLAGHEEERARIVRMFHDEVSSTMLAVLFAIESAKDELEAQNLPQAETVAKASELLQEVVEKISEVLEDKKDSGQQSSQ